MNYWIQETYQGHAQCLVTLLSHHYNIGKGPIYQFIKDKKILINGGKIHGSYRIKNNDEIIIKYPLIAGEARSLQNNYYEAKNLNHYRAVAKEWKSMIVEENSNFFVVNKPVGWATQDGTNSPYNLDDLLTYLEIPHYLVHRLDKDTSGLMLIAKNPQWAKLLTNLMMDKQIVKKYTVVTEYDPRSHWEGWGYIGEDKGPSNSLTLFEKIKDVNGYSHWSAQLITGKKHQSRLHCYWEGIPVIGDKKYQGLKSSRLMLHSNEISWEHNGINYKYMSPSPWETI